MGLRFRRTVVRTLDQLEAGMILADVRSYPVRILAIGPDVLGIRGAQVSGLSGEFKGRQIATLTAAPYRVLRSSLNDVPAPQVRRNIAAR